MGTGHGGGNEEVGTAGAGGGAGVGTGGNETGQALTGRCRAGAGRRVPRRFQASVTPGIEERSGQSGAGAGTGAGGGGKAGGAGERGARGKEGVGEREFLRVGARECSDSQGGAFEEASGEMQSEFQSESESQSESDSKVGVGGSSETRRLRTDPRGRGGGGRSPQCAWRRARRPGSSCARTRARRRAKYSARPCTAWSR